MWRARPLLGTIVDIWAEGLNANVAIEAAFAEIQEVQKLMSFHDPDSDVTRINRAPSSTAIPVDAKTYEVLVFAQHLSQISQGVFDITVGSTLISARFLPQLEGKDSNTYTVNYQHLKLLPYCEVLLTQPVCIDLGGIAKGYAVDVAIQCLRAHGMESGLVNAGGDLRFFGQPQIVHIRQPYESRALQLEPLENKAVASSSGYYSTKSEHGADSPLIDPLVNPKQARCQLWGLGFTVIAPTCMVADAMTKVVRLSRARALDILKTFDAQAIKIDNLGASLLQDTMQMKD